MPTTIRGVDNFDTAPEGLGKVLQVVSTGDNNIGTASATSSTSAVSTGVSLSITPKKATSKLIITFTCGMTYSATNDPCIMSIYNQDNTILTGGGYDSYSRSNSAGMYTPTHMCVEVFPNTLDTQTYTIYMRSGSGGTVYAIHSGSYYEFTITEIAQ